MTRAKTVGECLHAYGIHSATLQPELATPSVSSTTTAAPVDANPKQVEDVTANLAAATTATTVDAAPSSGASIRRRRPETAACQIVCGNLCEGLTCCNTPAMRI